MKKLIVLCILVMLSGCDMPEYEIICGNKGDMFKRYVGVSSSVDPLYNRSQICVNQPDGSILIKNVGKTIDK